MSAESGCRRLGLLGNLRFDLPASLVVFLVALPLCMAVAIASGMPPASGILTSIIGGIVVGLISGSPMQVSGPPAGLIVLVFQIVHQRGLTDLAVVLVLAGAIQIAAGLFRLAQWFRMVSPAVIQGMLAGIGALILFGQLHAMFDYQPLANGLDNLLTLPQRVWDGVVVGGDSGMKMLYAGFIGLLSLTVLVVWQQYCKKRLPIPGSLVAVVVAGVVTLWLGLPINHVDVPKSILGVVNVLPLEGFEKVFDGTIWIYAFAVALIASAESLLCATAVDQLHNGARTNYDQELAAQGVGNALCGFLGGLPMTGVIVRSSANIDAGARSRLSTMLHGAWMLALVSLLPFVLTYIPVASLAAILVFTGYKLINLKAVRELMSYGRGEVLIYAATLFMIVVEDLLVGVAVGVGLSLVKLLYVFTRLKIRTETSADRKHTILHLEGTATFLKLPKLAALESVPARTEMHVKFDELSYIDHACLDLIVNWAKQHQAQGGRLVIDWHGLHACFRKEDKTRPEAPMKLAS